MSLNRFAVRRDPGESAIVEALRKVGAMVCHVSSKGLPDLLVGFRQRWMLLEVKSPVGERGGKSRDGQKLQEAQAAFFRLAKLGGLPVHVVTGPEEALKAIGLEVA